MRAEVPVAYSCQGGDNPVNGRYINDEVIFAVDHDTLLTASIIEPAALGDHADGNPRATKDVYNRYKARYQVEDVTRLFNASFVQAKLVQEDPHHI